MSSTGVDRITGVDPSVAIKAPCGAASASNITLSGAQTIDGVAVTETTPKTRVLVTGQTSAIENGIYDVYTTAWVRSEDFNGSRDVVDGTLVSVDAGTAYTNSTWKVVAINPVSPGATSISFVRVNNFDSAIQSVATIADLRATAGLTDGQEVSLREHTTGYNSGGGNFIVDSTSVEPDDNGVFITASDGAKLRRKEASEKIEALAAWWGAHVSSADNIIALDTAHDFCEKYGKKLILPSTRTDAATVGYLEISVPWQVRQRVSIVGPGEDCRIRKNNNALGTGSATAPERPTVTDSFVVDAVMILEHSGSFPFDAHWEGFRLYSNGTGIGSYRPRAARMEVIDVSCHEVEYKDVTFTTFLSYFRKFMGFSPSGTLIHGFDWRDDGTAGGTGTSCTFDQCYDFGALDTPYNFYGLNYSTFNSPAADSYGDAGTSVYAYKLDSCVGMTFNSPGAESSVEGGMFQLINSTLTINSPKTFALNVTNGQANILANSGCDVVVNAPEFADFATTSGTTYNISAPTASEITVNNGRMSANATAIFNGDVHWERSMQNLISGNNGDADVSLTAGTSAGTQRFASTLTANRTVTLSTSGAWKGARFRISRTAATPGAFTLAVGSLATIPVNMRGFVDVEYSGVSWVLTAYCEFA